MAVAQASQVSYELHTLGWKAFQNLCATITSDLWGQTVEGYYDSHDGGRDGAFYGCWESAEGHIYTGSFTVQCKFTSTPNKQIGLADLKDELTKATRLAEKGLSDNYFLLYSGRITGARAEEIQTAFESIPGLKKCAVYGEDRITQYIRESSKLRMIVPRVYGLGDLTQILDERAYEQAQEILSAMGGDLVKFVITDAFRKSADALVDKGFVLLLGDPASGKSTIAAALALGALDNWGCSTIKARNAGEFISHFNPKEKQFFWIDDAFGATQFDWSTSSEWNSALPHINAALNHGSKILFTSRTYVYQSAKRHLKESSLPVMSDSQVVIHVGDLSEEEKEQILYNHIKFGTQLLDVKQKLKPYLEDVVSNSNFGPEIARRLGNPFFTENVSISPNGITQFVDRPVDFLRDTIQAMDDGSRAALALVFMNGGRLLCPLQLDETEKNAIARMGGTTGTVVEALEALDESFTINTMEGGHQFYRFKHPTIQDALANIVSSTTSLLDIYLTGAPLEMLFREIFCGNLGLEGAAIIVPVNQYDAVASRLEELDLTKWYEKSKLYRFLSHKVDVTFISLYLEQHRDFINKLRIFSQFYACSDLDMMVRLHQLGLLDEKNRLRAVSEIADLACQTPDSGFLNSDIKTLFTENEFALLLARIKSDFISDISVVVSDWKSAYDGDDEPEVYFDRLRSTVEEFKMEFDGDSTTEKLIQDGLMQIGEAIEELNSENSDSNESEENIFGGKNSSGSTVISQRSIFDDVDV